MGRSAKVHKRVSKKKNPTPNASIQPQVQAAKKKFKQKTPKKSGPGTPKSKGVLGGADYVTLFMGGRRKVDEEAKKMLQNSS